MKRRQMEADFFPCGQTDRYDEAVTFRNFAKAPKNWKTNKVLKKCQ